MTIYRCAHCSRRLELDEDGSIVPCEDHPDGAVEREDERAEDAIP